MSGRRAPKSLAVSLGLSLAVLIPSGCEQGRVLGGTDTGEATVAVLALSGADVARVEVTITGAGIDPAIVVDLTPIGDQWRGIIGHIPAGFDRTFTASALDAGDVELYHGSATGVVIIAGAKVTVLIVAQQVGPHSPFSNRAPVIDSLVASAVQLAPGDQIDLTVTASDPDPDDLALAYEWTAPKGTFTQATAATTKYQAPAEEGDQVVKVSVSDEHRAKVVAEITLAVSLAYAHGKAEVIVSLNTWPVVTAISVDPGRIETGQSVALGVEAVDADAGDSLVYSWTADCTGTWDDQTIASPVFTLGDTAPAGGTCTFTVEVDDGRGGTNTGDVTIVVGPPPEVCVPPQIVSDYQSTTTVADGSPPVVLRVGAVASDGGALTFAWSATAGTLGTPTNLGGTSQVVWNPPAPFTDTVTITVDVTDSAGYTTTATFGVQALVLCSVGQANCGGVCVDLLWDVANCGGCGAACDPTFTCMFGTCTCWLGTVCDGKCSNLASDPLNCGGCSNTCAPGETCAGGVCAGCTPCPTSCCAPGQICINLLGTQMCFGVPTFP